MRGEVADTDLAAVQARRMFPTRATQAAQIAIQKQVPLSRGRRAAARTVASEHALGGTAVAAPAAYLVGVGVRPGHARTG
jgi:hypothetical protein